MGDMTDDAERDEEWAMNELQHWREVVKNTNNPRRVSGSELEDDGLCVECGEPLGYIHYYDCEFFGCYSCLEKECVCT